MAKTSTAKTVPAPIPVKAPKTRLTKSMRDWLHRYMLDEFRRRLDKTEIDKTLEVLVERTNIVSG